MKTNTSLTVMSLVALLLTSLHVTDDIVRGISPAGADNLGGVVIFAVWLLGAVMLPDRRAGHALMALGGLFAAAMPVLHMRGPRYVTIANSGDGFFFVWTLFACGATGLIALILAVRALWMSRSARV